MAKKRLSNQVSRWASKAKARTVAGLRLATQTLVEEANRPVSQGGKMPVDTGFLRGSLAASFTDIPMPYGPPPELLIAQFSAGDVLFLGWTARYARHVEAKFFFMRSAAQRWTQFVVAAAREARAKIR